MNNVSRVTALDTAVTMTDGVALATDVTVADDGAQHPVLLIRTPYSRASVRGFHDAIGLARMGWAVVTQDVRGRWDSPGAFSPFRSERADGAATVAWCAAQPWSNGGVAMAGGSYNGFTQWLAAAERPAGLRVIAPAIAGPTIRDAIYEGGALQLGVFSSWTLGIGALGSNLDADVVAAAITELDGWPDVIRDGTEKTALPRISPDWVRWLDPDDAELWSSLDAGPALLDDRSTAAPPAGYHLAGWHDLFCESTIRGYSLLTGPEVDDSVRRRQRLVVGPWAHLSMLRRTTGRLDFGTAAQGDFSGLFTEQFAFMTGGVAGQDVPSGVRIFVMGANRWLDLADWPPPSTDTPLYLAGEGALSWSPPTEAGSSSYHHDPTDPVPTRGGRILHPVPPDAGPLDQRAIEQRPDVLVYTSEPLDRDIALIGTVRARLTFASTADRADVAVKLVDVHPDGRAMLVVDSIQRVATTPGTPREVGVDVGSTALAVAAGHRIRIEIASSNYPRFDTSPAGDQTVHHGGRALSQLTLPIFEGSV